MARRIRCAVSMRLAWRDRRSAWATAALTGCWWRPTRVRAGQGLYLQGKGARVNQNHPQKQVSGKSWSAGWGRAPALSCRVGRECELDRSAAGGLYPACARSEFWLGNFGLAGWCSLSVGVWQPMARRIRCAVSMRLAWRDRRSAWATAALTGCWWRPTRVRAGQGLYLQGKGARVNQNHPQKQVSGESWSAGWGPGRRR